MPCKVKVKVLAGRNLPVMDRAGDTTDAFVEIKFGGVTHKTDVCRKSLNPQWNSTEWYRFEVDESELQDEPLQLRVMDHDTYSANDAIGKVVISLSPMLAREPAPTTKGAAVPQTGAVMSGWIPVFDTLHGIRGELNVIVKVELFSDFNKYKTSSCGVQFFHCPMVPPGYRATAVHGFVEELVVNDDPEYQWIDKIRTPRASNEARQAAFIKLSNQVQRLVGLKAAELGANAVVGYQQAFDLEGEAGVVARAIGTAISIVALPTPSQPSTAPQCSQQQLKKYLDILAADNESITDLNVYFQSHQEELSKLLHILHPKLSSNFLDEQENDDDEKIMTLSRQSSMKAYTDNVSIYQDEYISHKSLRHITDDQGALNKLLYNDDRDFEEESLSPLKKIKKIKRNLFMRRFGSSRSKKSDKQDDQISIKSNSSDTSRISLSDLKLEFKKLKRLKKPKLRRVVNDTDDGIGMASILARSVIHAQTSLACIAETQDSEQSPCSTLRRTSESEPAINMSDEERMKVEADSSNKKDDTRISLSRELPQIQFGSLKNVNIEEEKIGRHRKLSESCPNTPMVGRSENFLKLPDEAGYFGSVSSALSCESSELYTSTDEEDDESSDIRTDTEKSIETTSSIIQSVLRNEANPVFISQMDKKLSNLEFKGSPDKVEIPYLESDGSDHSFDNTDNKVAYNMAPDTIPKLSDEEFDKKNINVTPKTGLSAHSTHSTFKFHNPFAHKKVSKSLSAPSSPVDKKPNIVYRSTKRLKRQISKLSKSSFRSLSHYSLVPKNKHADVQPLRHSSGSDGHLKTHSRETVLGSPFLSYSDLLSLDIDHNNLVVTPMLGPQKLEEKERSQTVHMYIGSEPASRASVSCPSSPRILEHKEEIHDHESKHHKKEKAIIKPTGLLHTAMETILLDKVQSLMIPTSPDPISTNTKEKKFFEDVNEKLEKVASQSSKDNSQRKLVRQDSLHSLTDVVEPPSDKMSKENETHDHTTNTSHTVKSELVLQHLHPILSGPIHHKLSHLETIPSLPESVSFDRDFSIDDSQPNDTKDDNLITEAVSNISKPEELENIDTKSDISDTNNRIPLESSVVCDNSHAACRGSVHRERERDKDKDRSDKDKGSPRHARHESYGGRDPGSAANAHQSHHNTSLQASSTPVGIHRRSSDSDLSITPKGGSLNASAGNTGTGGGAILKPSMNSNNIDLLEYPFLTMLEYPTGFIVHIGGTVCARSVKLLDGGGEAAARAAWWAELRTELRAHARALRCNAVLAYTETAAICEDVCVLSASGTAAVINLDCDFSADIEDPTAPKQPSEELYTHVCSPAHIPYSAGGGPYRAELMPCAICRRSRVPSVLLATCSRPHKMLAYVRHTTLTAVAARVRRAPPQSEPGARDISDQLPFLEYELHKLLLAKLRMQGANALFNLNTQIAIGERSVVALASGTAVRLAALPAPTPPRIKASESDKEALELQKALWDTFTANKAANGYDISLPEHITNGVLPEVENEDSPALDLCADKDACVLELDETEEVETARSLSVRRFYLPVITQHPQLHQKPRGTPYAFAQMWRGRFSGGTLPAEKAVARALDGVHYKLRTLTPCALAPVKFQIELSEDELQLVVSGAAIPLTDPTKIEPFKGAEDSAQNARSSNINNSANNQAGDAEDDIFSLEEDQTSPKHNTSDVVDDRLTVRNEQVPTTVALTPLSSLSGVKRHRCICALRLLFVRETTSVRELGGMSGFLHTTMCEVLAIVRAYTAALGGNALTSFYITQLMLQDNAHKNQGQCLLSVGGDVVHITY